MISAGADVFQLRVLPDEPRPHDLVRIDLGKELDHLGEVSRRQPLFIRLSPSLRSGRNGRLRW
ncbi:hypothetical protein ACPPVW_18275 [Leifsonia sp. McL0607]|uniref:hypothetical protein n=1 Tax=Leifsonia sp. McL0607 TaxID=3415672 RepID=UPI003CEA8C45